MIFSMYIYICFNYFHIFTNIFLFITQIYKKMGHPRKYFILFSGSTINSEEFI